MSPISSKVKTIEKRPASSPSSRPPSVDSSRATDLRVEVPEDDAKKVVLPVVSPIKKSNDDSPPGDSTSVKKLNFGSVVMKLTKPSRNRWQETYKKALRQSAAGDLSLYTGKEAAEGYRILYKEYRRWENFPRNDTPRCVVCISDCILYNNILAHHLDK